MADLSWLTYADFAGRVGERFDLTADVDPPMVLELVGATEGSELGGPGPEGEERRQFALVFRGPATPVLPQATYSVVHADVGELALFLVPIGPAAEGMQYEAAFA